MGLSTLLSLLLLPLPQQPANATSPRVPTPNPAPASTSVVDPNVDNGLIFAATNATIPAAFRLGDGGVHADFADRDQSMPGEPGSCTTPGGVRVDCQREGVKLTFPSGREVLCAPDGYVHLRCGSVAGPFESGLELLLADGSAVRIDRSGSRRAPIVAVDVIGAETAVTIWRRGSPVRERVRGDGRLPPVYCLGDGGALYRAAAAGPLVALSRVLAPREVALARKLPQERLCLQVGPMVESLQALSESREARLHPEAAKQVALILDQRSQVWREDLPVPPRTNSSPLQYLLLAGYDLTLREDNGVVAVELARHQEDPFVVWRLGYIGSVCYLDDSPQSGLDASPLPVVTPRLQVMLLRNDIREVTSVLEKVSGKKPATR